MDGQHTLHEYLAVVGHCHELCRAHPDDTVHVRIFLGAAFEAGMAATNEKGSWSQSWPLLGIEDPDGRKRMSLMFPVEKAAMTALHKEKALLEKSRGPR